MSEVVGIGTEQETVDGVGSGSAKRWRRVALSERDWEVLTWAHEQKFLEFDQVARWFPEGSANPQVPPKATATRGTLRRRARPGSWYVAERLRKLVRFDVLRRVPVFTQPAAALLPGRVGFDLLVGSARGHGLARLDGIDWKNYAHDRAVTDLRWQLACPPSVAARHGMAPRATEWKSERVLRRELGSGQVPDAVMLIGTRRIAVELELTRKSVPRYLSIFDRYLRWRGPRLDAVLYVLPESADLRQMFAVVLPAALRAPELWGARTPDLRLFQFTTRAALCAGKLWSTASLPSAPAESALWER